MPTIASAFPEEHLEDKSQLDEEFTDFPPHYTPDEIEAWAGFLTVEGYEPGITHNLFLVAEEAKTPVGFAELDRSNGVVEAVYVAPTHGGRGIGTRLLLALEVHAKEQHLPRLKLLSSLGAMSFYKRAGFQLTGEAVHPIPGIPVVFRCVPMEKSLTSVQALF